MLIETAKEGRIAKQFSKLTAKVNQNVHVDKQTDNINPQTEIGLQTGQTVSVQLYTI